VAPPLSGRQGRNGWVRFGPDADILVKSHDKHGGPKTSARGRGRRGAAMAGRRSPVGYGSHADLNVQSCTLRRRCAN